MTQTIKPNDLVYVPSLTNRLCKVHLNDEVMDVEVTKDTFYTINTQGQKYDYGVATWGTQPFAFLATPEMKEKLEQVYGKLEDIPVDKELKEFCEVIEKLLDADFNRIDNGFDFSEVDKFKNQLIQMFKERGSK